MSGLLTGAFGTGGPPVMVLFAAMKDISKGQIRGTISAMTLLSMPMRIFVAFFFDVFDFSNEWPLYILAFVMMAVGIHAGKVIHRRMDGTHVRYILAGLVLVSSVTLVFGDDLKGEFPAFFWVMTVVYCFAAIAAVVLLSRVYRTRKAYLLRVEQLRKRGGGVVAAKTDGNDDADGARGSGSQVSVEAVHVSLLPLPAAATSVNDSSGVSSRTRGSTLRSRTRSASNDVAASDCPA
jgi:hypothetical protein